MTITTPNGFKIGQSTTKLYAIKVDTLSVERPVVQVYKDDCNTLSSLWPPYMWKKNYTLWTKTLVCDTQYQSSQALSSPRLIFLHLVNGVRQALVCKYGCQKRCNAHFMPAKWFIKMFLNLGLLALLTLLRNPD